MLCSMQMSIFLSQQLCSKIHHEITDIYWRTLWNDHQFCCQTPETDAWLAKLQVRALCSRLSVSGNTSNEYLWKQWWKRNIIKGDSWCRQVPDSYFKKKSPAIELRCARTCFHDEESYPEFWGSSSLSCWRPGCLSPHWARVCHMQTLANLGCFDTEILLQTGTERPGHAFLQCTS